MESSSHKNEFSLINTPNPDNNKTKQIKDTCCRRTWHN